MAEETIDIISLNVRGLNEGKKRREIFRWLKRYHKGREGVVFLQETHSQKNVEVSWEKDWGSKIFFAHGTNNARGVAILMPEKFNFDIKNKITDEQGRFISITLKIADERYTLVNIYAPTKDKVTDQIKLIQNLERSVDFTENKVIFGGDFNKYMNPLFDKDGGQK